ncbi:unnamed protein product [Aphanomyces euteiches]
MDMSRNEALQVAEAFVQAFTDVSKQNMRANALSDLKAACRSLQFVAHIQALPIFTSVLDAVCACCFDAGSSELNEDIVNLVYDMVHGATIGYPTPLLGKVLSALVHTISRDIVENSSFDGASFLLHLETLAACLHNNVGVRLYVSELPDRKELVRTLALMLNRTDDAHVLVYSMSILARLVLHEPVGRKLFQPKNVEHAISLVASVVTSVEMDHSRDTLLVQLACIDLIADLVSQPWILTIVEGSEEFRGLITDMMARIDLNENVVRLQVALHFLYVVATISHPMRKEMGKSFPPLSKALQVVLHPMPLVAKCATKFFISFLSDDRALVEGLINSTCPTVDEKLIAPLQPVLIALFKTLHTAITLFVRQDAQFDACMDDYTQAVGICQLLIHLSVDARVASLSLPLVNLSQMVGLAQRESQYLNSLSTEQATQYIPRFSLAFMTLVGTLMLHDDEAVEEDQLREFNQVLQQPDVAEILSRGLSQCEDKQWTLDKSQEVVAIWRSRLSQSETALHMAHKQIEHLKAEIELVKANADDERLQCHTEHARLQKELDLQRSAHEHVVEALTAKFESQMTHMKAKCDEVMGQLREKSQAFEKKQRQLQESRVQRCTLEEESNGLKRKLIVLEMRIDEVAQAQASTRGQVDHLQREKQRVQAELEALSEAYASQSGDLLVAQETCQKLKVTVSLQEENHETLYKQLVMLSKAHQMQSEEFNRTTEERDQLVREIREARATVDNLNAQTDEQAMRIQTHKEHLADLEKGLAQTEHMLHDEKARCRGLQSELETLRHHHVKIQNEMLAKDGRMLDLQRLYEANEKNLSQRDEDIRRLRTELKKYAKIQAMIHQLSDEVPHRIEMIVQLVKAILWGGLSAAYVRSTTSWNIALAFISNLTDVPGNALSEIQGGFAVRLLLTLFALTLGIGRVSTTYLVPLSLLIGVNSMALYSIYNEQTYDVLPWDLPLQMVFFGIMAAVSYSLLVAIAFFAPPPLTERQKYRAQLIAFYEEYNPAKIPDVDNILRRYRLHEEVLFTRLKKKYIDADPTETVEDDQSDEDDSAVTNSRPSQKNRPPQVNTPVQHAFEDEEEQKDEAPSERAGTPPRSNSGYSERADLKPKVHVAVEEVQAAQRERVEQRIRQMGRKK